MKLCGITELASLGSFSVRDIDAVRISPIGVSLSHPVGTPGRMRNGFMLIEDGECEFELKPTAEKQRLVLKPGELAYIPHGANYRLEATKHPFILSRVSFRLFCGGDEVFFSDSPILVLPDAGFKAIPHNSKHADAPADFSSDDTKIRRQGTAPVKDFCEV